MTTHKYPKGKRETTPLFFLMKGDNLFIFFINQTGKLTVDNCYFEL